MISCVLFYYGILLKSKRKLERYPAISLMNVMTMAQFPGTTLMHIRQINLSKIKCPSFPRLITN